MEKFYYVTSDGSNMEIDDFLAYVNWLEEEEIQFAFEAWFDENDFSSPEAYAFVKEILKK